MFHQIGSADAYDVTVTIVAGRVDGRSDRTVLVDKRIDKLDFPVDLVAKTAAVDFQWTPKSAGRHRLEASVQCGDRTPEIYLGNNTARRMVTVAAP